MVGCVLVRDNEVIARGHHAHFGGPHAEAAALAGDGDAAGATAYVTLEPCCHHGKTPPCADALVAAGVRRVVVGSIDPSAESQRRRHLKACGRRASRWTSACNATLAIGVIAPFAKLATTGLPWIIAKWAMTADGRISTRTGESRWITGSAARRDVHRVRGQGRCDRRWRWGPRWRTTRS